MVRIPVLIFQIRAPDKASIAKEPHSLSSTGRVGWGGEEEERGVKGKRGRRRDWKEIAAPNSGHITDF